MTAKVICASEEIAVFVGNPRQHFVVHKALLTLNSGFLRIAFEELHECAAAEVPWINPFVFLAFCSWLYCGHLLQVSDWLTRRISLHFWAHGVMLSAPGFANFCMDKIMEYAKMDAGRLIETSVVRACYERARSGSLLRKFFVDLINFHELFKTALDGKILLWSDLAKLLTEFPELSADIVEAEMNYDQSRSAPWHNRNRNSYILYEPTLNDLWELQIYATGFDGEIRDAAALGHMRSILYHAHITRDRKVGELDQDDRSWPRANWISLISLQ